MKKHSSAIFVCLIVCVLFYAIPAMAQPQWVWAKNGNANVSAVTTDQSGNIYATGNFEADTIYFGTTMLTNPVGTFYHRNFFLVKYDKLGNVLWATSAQYEYAMNDYFEIYPAGLTTDAGGNIYISGTLRCDAVMFGTIPVSALGPHVSQFFVKYNSDGTALWVKEGFTNHYSSTSTIATDNQNHVYFAGNYNETLTLNGVNLSGPEAASCMYLMRTDTNGNLQWIKTTIGPSQCKVALNNLNQPVIAGQFNDTFMAGSVMVTTNNNYHFFVATMDTAGSFLWAKTGVEIPYSRTIFIATDTSGNTFIAGCYDRDTVQFGTVVLTKPATDSTDIFLAKYDATGNCAWAQTAQGSLVDNITAIACDPHNNLYITGTFQSPEINFQGNILHNFAPDSTNNYDFFVVRYDESGNVVWAMENGGIGWNSPTCITVGGSENELYVAGAFYGSPSLVLGTDTVFCQPVTYYSTNMFIGRLGDFTAVTNTDHVADIIRAYPNPASNEITIETTDEQLIAVTLYDMIGRTIHCPFHTMGKNEATMNLRSILPGTYIVQVQSEGGRYSLPLQVMR